MLPEAVNFLLSEDEGVLDMINEVASFTLTSYPGKNIQTALKILADGLRERSLKVETAHTYAYVKHSAIHCSSHHVKLGRIIRV